MKQILIFILMLATIPAVFASDLGENYPSGDTSAFNIQNTQDVAQSFLGNATEIDNISLYLTRNSNPTLNTSIYIFSVTAGEPDTLVQSCDNITPDAIPADTTNWVNVSCGGVKLNNGTIYAIVGESLNSGATKYGWRADGTSPTYANGSLHTAPGDLSTWTADPTYDALFMIWHKEVPSFTITVTLKDEFNDETITDEGFINLIGENFGYTDNKSVNVTGQASFTIADTDDYRISYTSSKYSERDYCKTFNDTISYEEALYLLSETNSTDITITVVDETAKELNNATVKMYRYFATTNTYKEVAHVKTDSTGKGQIDVDLFDGFYYFSIEKEGNLLLTTDPARVIDTTISFNVFVDESIWTSRKSIDKVTHSFYFDNATQNFRFIYNDGAGLVKEACLKVEKVGFQSGGQVVCDNCSTASSGTLLCAIPDVNTSYRGYARIETNTKNSPYIQSIVDYVAVATKESIDKFGDMGIYLSAYGIMSLALLGTPYPYISIPLAIIGFIFAAIMGILGISYTALVTIVIIASLVIWKVRQ